MTKGNIILLNGTSSSGKTVIAKALQEIMEGYYVHTGIDHYLERIPEKFHVISDGKTPSEADGIMWVYPEGGTRLSELRLGPAGINLVKGIYHAVAALADEANDLILDDVIFDPTALREAVNVLSTFNTLFVGVRCPLKVAKQREQERGDRTLGLVEAHYDIVHSHGIYDLEIDTSVLTPTECASQIKDRLQNGPPPNAIQKLRDILFV
jgi:chloramphenicol 3-O phosphotransferase